MESPTIASGKTLSTSFTKMRLEQPTDKFITEILDEYSYLEEDELNGKLLKLFKEFNDDKNKFDVLIKVASLNKIYATAITNINPVVQQINKIASQNYKLEKIDDYVDLVDKISNVKWTNDKKEEFKRNNLSFASKYVHFLSDYKTPIYDSYVWIVIKGYFGQYKNRIMSFGNPKDYKEFYSIFEDFKKSFELVKYSNYQIDKFLWTYGKSMIESIKEELQISLEKAKTELKNRIKASSQQTVGRYFYY